jgi:hypothetical protein
MKPLKKLNQSRKSNIIFKLIFLFAFSYCSAYSQKTSQLLVKLNKLQYDSVKILSFNCSSSVQLEKYGLIADTSLITSDQKWAYTISQYNRIVNKTDVKKLFKILFDNEIIEKDGDPQGCYRPRLGFAFFNKGIVVAHIDVCLECDKAIMEIFEKDKKEFRYFFKTLRYRTKLQFDKLSSKYDFPLCTL